MTTNHKGNTRAFQRIFHDANAELSLDGKVYHCQVRDLSLRGCLLVLPDALRHMHQHTIVQLKICLSAETEISMEMRNVHNEDRFAGFEVLHIDLDNMTRLRRLMELNLGDAQLLERDLQNLIVYHQHS